MEIEEKQMQELLELTRENNEMLKGVYRRARWGMFFWIARWVLILGILFGAYYYVEPHLTNALNNYQKSMDVIKQVQQSAGKFTDTKALQAILGSTSTSSPLQDASFVDTVIKILKFGN